MFGLFKKKATQASPELSYDWLAVDMHSHVLPGIDDGAQTPEESIFLIREMMNLGIRKIIATPHIMADYFRNNRTTITNALAVLREALDKEGLDITVEAAAEHFFDETFEPRIDNDELMIIAGKYVLFEFSFISRPPVVFPVIEKILKKGLVPILAHPERYNYLTLDEIKNIRSYGCLLQLNTVSLTGYYGKSTKAMAEALAEAGLVDFISSDMHHPRHALALKDSLQLPAIAMLKEKGALRNFSLL